MGSFSGSSAPESGLKVRFALITWGLFATQGATISLLHVQLHYEDVQQSVEALVTFSVKQLAHTVEH